MVQIKLFQDRTSYVEEFESTVNEFLKENEDKIIVRDIKYTSEKPNFNESARDIWTVMIIYDLKPE
jgi:hypothetical protein